jgi:hypothetical protein
MSFKKIIFPFFFLMLCFGAHSQDFSALVSKAWEHNQQLKAREFQLESANHLFKEAKSMYGPTVGFGVNTPSQQVVEAFSCRWETYLIRYTQL